MGLAPSLTLPRCAGEGTTQLPQADTHFKTKKALPRGSAFFSFLWRLFRRRVVLLLGIGRAGLGCFLSRVFLRRLWRFVTHKFVASVFP